MRPAIRRPGFTLAEVLVTLAILATLIAVLLPAVLGQLSKGDAVRTANDLLAVRTGISTFVSDVKRYPDSVGHLTRAITGRKDINGAVYPSGLAERWKGPYLDKDPISPGDSIGTAYGRAINGDLAKGSYNGISYVTVQIVNLQAADFDEVDRIIDETANSSTGRLQMSGTAAVYFAIPIQ